MQRTKGVKEMKIPFSAKSLGLLFSSAFLLVFTAGLAAGEEAKNRQLYLREQLAAYNARTLTELLNALPGISVGSGGIKIQGSSSSNVVVLIDGRRITDSATKSSNISGYFAGDIHQIAVVKGAGASIYGDDTAGGVILITTRKAEAGTKATMEAYLDTYKRGMVMGRIVNQQKASARGGTLQLAYGDGDENYMDFRQAMVKNIFWQRQQDNGAKWRINFDGLYGIFLLPGLSHAPTPNAEAVGYDWNLTAAYEDNRLKSQIYYTGYGDDYRNPNIDFRHQYLSHVLGETVNYTLELPWLGTAPAGGTLEHHIITSNNFKTQEESQAHLFATKDWAPAKWINMGIGLRLSCYTAFGWGVNPELTLLFPMDPWTFRLNANRSHNTPSIYNRFYNTTYIRGNPDLGLEKVHNVSLGFSWEPNGKIGLSCNTFYSWIDDAVAQNRYGDYTTYDNLDAITRKGGEFSIDIKPLKMLNLNLSYVYLLAKNSDTGLFLIEKPEHTFKYTVTAKWKNYSLTHKGRYTSSYYSDSDNLIEIPGRYLADIRIGYAWKNYYFYLDVTNLLDRAYETYYGRPGNKRIFRIGLQMDF